jgi:beta-lactamase class A
MPRLLFLRTRILFLVLITFLSLARLIEPVGGAQDATPVAPDELNAQIPRLLATCDSVFGVVIIDANDNVVFEQNADVPFVSASLYKLVLLTQTLAKIEQGELSFDQTVEIQSEFYLQANGEDSYFSYGAVGYAASVEELIYSAGAYSSNVGALALVSLTSRSTLETFANQLGLTHTQYWIEPDQVGTEYGQLDGKPASLDYARSAIFIESFAGDGVINLTTPRDMATFFRLLRDNELASPLVSWQLKQVLEARVINDRIPALLPADTVVIHKTGNLEGVLHDVGIIETDSGPVIAIAMAQAATDIATTQVVEQRLGVLAFQIGQDGPQAGIRVSTPVATPLDP